MGKEKPGFLTPKAIANRIKSKGLQKLRWYCQMCQKQCRDENGFKCHTTSEAHQRQLLLFGENSQKFMDEFSGTFHREYMTTLKRRFGTKRVNANIVYQECIHEKDHIHMNSTKWLTLSDYVQYIGKIGACVVEQTEKGWFVTYIDRDPEVMRRQEEIQKKTKLDLDDRDRQKKFLDQQIEKDKESGNYKQHEATDLQKNDDQVVKINFLKKTKTEPIFKEPEIPKLQIKIEPNKAFKEEEVDTKVFPSTSTSKNSDKRKISALDDIISSEEKSREKQNRKDYWLHKDIVVRIVTNKLGEKYYKKKAIVTDIQDKYTGVVKLIDSGTTIKLDQAHLESVLPALGKKVIVLNGAYRGEIANLESINVDKFNAKITLSSGNFKGRSVNSIQYEDISKLYQEK